MQLQINNNQKEIKTHGSYSFPVNISHEVLSHYEQGSFLSHWHPEIEFTLILKGEILYQVKDNRYHLKQGEGLWGNENTLHNGQMVEQNDCEYVSITFNPRLIYGYEASLVQTKYVDHILKNQHLASLHFTQACAWHKDILEDLHTIYLLYCNKPVAYEMHIQMLLTKIWLHLYTHYRLDCHLLPNLNVQHTERLETILNFIKDHYSEKITLEDIANTINICKSECCRFFKKHMKQSLFNYLMNYRIEQSLPLLTDPNHNITEISQLVGFSDPSYFTKIFKQHISCSPSEYRRNHLNHI